MAYSLKVYPKHCIGIDTLVSTKEIEKLIERINEKESYQDRKKE